MNRLTSYLAAITLTCTPTSVLAQDALRWDWQLSPPLDLTKPLDAITLDPDLVSPAQMAALNVPLRICNVSVGTLEQWRGDVTAFPDAVVGAPDPDRPDERFLDIRQLAVVLPIMQARFTRCRDLGFNAIEADNIDLHIRETGFPIGHGDVVTYATALAGIAHGLGLRIGQKNAPELTHDLVRFMDFAVAENCLSGNWCADLAAYRLGNKPIFVAEYMVPQSQQSRYCDLAQRFGLTLIFKTRSLGADGAACSR